MDEQRDEHGVLIALVERAVNEFLVPNWEGLGVSYAHELRDADLQLVSGLRQLWDLYAAGTAITLKTTSVAARDHDGRLVSVDSREVELGRKQALGLLTGAIVAVAAMADGPDRTRARLHPSPGSSPAHPSIGFLKH